MLSPPFCPGISRDSLHKRRATGGRQKAWRKKKKYELGRQPANTKLSSHVAVRTVRTRGGNTKFRALRLDHGNYSWGSEVRRRRRELAAQSCRLRAACHMHTAGGPHPCDHPPPKYAGGDPQGAHPGRQVQRLQQ